MVELTSEDLQALNKERAGEIFQNIFSEIYLANCGNPVDYETTKTEIEKKMKLQFDDAKLELFEKFFSQADDKNVSLGEKSLRKEQMRAFLLKCMESYIFEDFFA